MDLLMMPNHNDVRAMLEGLRFPPDRPSFYLLHGSETHSPYALPGEPPETWPRLSGLHGAFKHLGDQAVEEEERLFDPGKLDELRLRPVDAVRSLDGLFQALYDRMPRNTWITVTIDHGERFGQGGWFGHGPIQHQKVFEVPFVEGRLR